MRKILQRAALVLTGVVGFVGAASAQSTDGFHTIQVFPVVVDTATFTQRFFFANANEQAIEVEVKYFPGDGTAQAGSGPLTCPTFQIGALSKVTFSSLRQMCPGLTAGSAFGFLYTAETTRWSLPYSGYSRVNNFAGNGFSVEAFPAHTFTSAESVVTGIRRLAATQSSPAYQSNCFLANMNEIGPVGGAITNVEYEIIGSNGASIATSSVNLAPGRLTRLLDVFAAAGAPAGDYNDADVIFRNNSGTGAGLLTFCTVQDNTSFGADFRIGKQAYGSWGVASEDGHVVRDVANEQDAQGRVFEIGSGNSANTHVTFFRHPDYATCALYDPNTGDILTAGSGLEMRLLHAGNVIAGGNNQVSFFGVYLGDKEDKDLGSNSMYTVEVESNEQNTGVSRPYGLYCATGSGSPGLLNIIEYKQAVDRF